MPTYRYPVATLLVVGLAACQSVPDTAPDMETTYAAIETRTRQFTEAHVTGDRALLDSIFTADARVYPPDADAIVGRAAISRVNAEYLSYGISAFRKSSRHRQGSGDLLVDEGTYVLTYGPDDTSEEGYYMNVWRRVDDEWFIEVNTWTRAPAVAGSE